MADLLQELLHEGGSGGEASGPCLPSSAIYHHHLGGGGGPPHRLLSAHGRGGHVPLSKAGPSYISRAKGPPSAGYSGGGSLQEHPPDPRHPAIPQIWQTSSSHLPPTLPSSSSFGGRGGGYNKPTTHHSVRRMGAGSGGAPSAEYRESHGSFCDGDSGYAQSVEASGCQVDFVDGQGTNGQFEYVDGGEIISEGQGMRPHTSTASTFEPFHHNDAHYTAPSFENGHMDHGIDQYSMPMGIAGPSSFGASTMNSAAFDGGGAATGDQRCFESGSGAGQQYNAPGQAAQQQLPSASNQFQPQNGSHRHVPSLEEQEAIVDGLIEWVVDLHVLDEVFSEHREASMMARVGLPYPPPPPEPPSEPPSKKGQEVSCPECARPIAATRFAPHLDKCIGFGRNSSRLARQKIQKGSQEASAEPTPSRTPSDEEEPMPSGDDEDDAEWTGQKQVRKRGQRGGRGGRGKKRRKEC